MENCKSGKVSGSLPLETLKQQNNTKWVITLNKTSGVFKGLDKYIELAEKVRIVKHI